MTRTEERLADALDAAARALQEDTLRPLVVPEPPRHRFALAAPLAAAAGLLLVVGIGVAVASYLPGSGRPANSAQGAPAYYVEAPADGHPPVVRSTATGQVTATVGVPHARATTWALVTAAANGIFFTVVPAATGEQVYRFRLSAAGRVGDLSRVPGGALAGTGWTADAMAASPDGSRLAVALTSAAQDDHIDVVNTATGTKSVWQGGIAQKYAFRVLDLSWTSNGELAYFGQWCPHRNPDAPSCWPGMETGGAKAEVRGLRPTGRGGSLNGGVRLFRPPAGISFIAQALISLNGSTITAVAVTPGELAVEQISIATGRRERVLYRRTLVSIASRSVLLSSDGSGRYWMVDGVTCVSSSRCGVGFNGWIHDGQLVPLQPSGGSAVSEAW